MKIIVSIIASLLVSNSFPLSFSKKQIILNTGDKVAFKNSGSGTVRLDSIRIISDSSMVPLQFTSELKIATFDTVPSPCNCAILFYPDSVNNNVFIGGEKYPSSSGMTRGFVSLIHNDSIVLGFGSQDYMLKPNQAPPRAGNVFKMIFYQNSNSDTLNLIAHDEDATGISNSKKTKFTPTKFKKFSVLGRVIK